WRCCWAAWLARGLCWGVMLCVITTRSNLFGFKENGQGGDTLPVFFAGCDDNIASAYPATH
ncbi:TPA: hypothetical protein ACHJSI_006121, partial [Escherichia coli]